MKKAYVYWDHIEIQNKRIDFPNDPNLLYKILEKIEMDKLEEFCQDCDFEFMQSKVNDTLRESLLILGEKKILEYDKTEEFLISLTKSILKIKKISNYYKMTLLDILESIDPLGKYEKGEERFIKEINVEDEDKVMLIENLKNEYLKLKEIENLIENTIKNIMEKYAPNLLNVAGPVLGAELIAQAGGLQSLSKMPGSRIQILGAGKSFYLSKKFKKPGPKHGIIFRHPFVHGSKNRGKNARWFANKISIAARIDFYRKELDNDFINDVKIKMTELK